MVEVRRTEISEAQWVPSLQGARTEAIQNGSRSGELALRSPARPQTPRFVRHGYVHIRTFLKALIARIDLPNFPGSCCG
jgi:hypothetical protein